MPDPQGVPFATKEVKESSICSRFTAKTCQRPALGCLTKRKEGWRKLYHLCSYISIDGAGNEKLCGGNHARPDHK